MTFKLSHLATYPVFIRLIIFISVLLSVWLPGAIPIYLIFRSDPNLVSILTMGLLYLIFIGLLRWWNLNLYQNPQWLQVYGLVPSLKNRNELLRGLSIGLVVTVSLFALELLLGWVTINSPPEGFLKILIEGMLIALAIGSAEELFFRGWLLEELQRDYSPAISLWTNALIYALLHFLKPLAEIWRTFPQFPALILLGLILVWARRSHSQRLGMSIGLHAGLVWGYYIFNVGKLLNYTEKVPAWMTGIDNNPLAGLTGIAFLGILGFWLRRKAVKSIDINGFPNLKSN